MYLVPNKDRQCPGAHDSRHPGVIHQHVDQHRDHGSRHLISIPVDHHILPAIEVVPDIYLAEAGVAPRPQVTSEDGLRNHENATRDRIDKTTYRTRSSRNIEQFEIQERAIRERLAVFD